MQTLNRRHLLRSCLGFLGASAAGQATVTGARTVLIQESPVAGFQFHDGEAVWSSLAVGDPVELIREPANVHDPDAVGVVFQGSQLGYVPRRENRAVAQMLDRGESLQATIARLQDSDDPWQRVMVRIGLAP